MKLELPSLIQRCLTYGVKIYPYQLNTIMEQYETKNIPSVCLNVLKKEDVEKYVNALYLSGQEMARDWSKGHTMLKELGFQAITREESHRTFISLEYVK